MARGRWNTLTGWSRRTSRPNYSWNSFKSFTNLKTDLKKETLIEAIYLQKWWKMLAIDWHWHVITFDIHLVMSNAECRMPNAECQCWMSNGNVPLITVMYTGGNGSSEKRRDRVIKDPDPINGRGSNTCRVSTSWTNLTFDDHLWRSPQGNQQFINSSLGSQVNHQGS